MKPDKLKVWLQTILLAVAVAALVANAAVTYARVGDNTIDLQDKETRLRKVEEATGQIQFIREDISDMKTDIWHIRNDE